MLKFDLRPSPHGGITCPSEGAVPPFLSPVTFDLKTVIKVQLTAHGEYVLAKYKIAEYEKNESFLTEARSQEFLAKNPKNLEGARFFKVWELLEIFGNHMDEDLFKSHFSIVQTKG